MPDLANFNTGKLPLAAPNREVRRRSSDSPELAEGTQKNIEIQVFSQFMSALIFQLGSEGKNLRRFVTKGLSNRGRSPPARARVR